MIKKKAVVLTSTLIIIFGIISLLCFVNIPLFGFSQRNKSKNSESTSKTQNAKTLEITSEYIESISSIVKKYSIPQNKFNVGIFQGGTYIDEYKYLGTEPHRDVSVYENPKQKELIITVDPSLQKVSSNQNIYTLDFFDTTIPYLEFQNTHNIFSKTGIWNEIIKNKDFALVKDNDNLTITTKNKNLKEYLNKNFSVIMAKTWKVYSVGDSVEISLVFIVREITF